MEDLDRAVEILKDKRQILVFSGAGISTESGIPDFRGPNGLWTRVDPDDFNISRYLSNRELRVRGWRMHANGERWGSGEPSPNRGHQAVVDLWRNGQLAGVVTQNIDGLQQAAGLPDELIAELHGNVKESHCLDCGLTWPTDAILERVVAGEEDPHCSTCGGLIKTRVVMFGEGLDPTTVDLAYQLLAEADALIVVGSTVAVYPASDVVLAAAFKPVPVVIINMGETEADYLAATRLDGPIGELLPALVAALSIPDG